jgi:hypothetical protein
VPRIPGMLTNTERAGLAPKPRAYLQDAERRARTAVSLFDVGIARGLLLALVKEGVITASQYDRMFKRVFAKVKRTLREEVMALPKARLGGAVVVPAAPRTRRRQRRTARATRG